MGLDVYLYKCEDWGDALTKEEKCEELSEKIWEEYGDYDNLTDAQKEEANKRVRKLEEDMGLGDWGCDPRKQKVNIPTGS